MTHRVLDLVFTWVTYLEYEPSLRAPNFHILQLNRYLLSDLQMDRIWIHLNLRGLIWPDPVGVIHIYSTLSTVTVCMSMSQSSTLDLGRVVETVTKDDQLLKRISFKGRMTCTPSLDDWSQVGFHLISHIVQHSVAVPKIVASRSHWPQGPYISQPDHYLFKKSQSFFESLLSVPQITSKICIPNCVQHQLSFPAVNLRPKHRLLL